MNKIQFELLTIKHTSIITVFDLIDTTNRILIYGYNFERDTVKVKLYNGTFIKTIYKYGIDSKVYPIEYNEDLVPNKRVYPEKSDFEFCQLLISRGIHIPFTNFSEKNI